MTSVLTFILLVVLVGGVGLLVVSLAESSKPTAEEPSVERAGDPPDPEPDRPREPVAAPVAEPVAAAVAAPVPAPIAVPAAPRYDLGPPRRRRIPSDVPRSQVAIEGRFADVARPPVWRRVVALVGIAVITVLSGVVIAVVLAAAIGAAAELVNTAIG